MRHSVQNPATTIAVLHSVIALALCPVITCASTWDVTPNIESTVVITDNIELATRGNEESELMLSVTPGIRASRDEGRTQVSINYGLDNLYFARNPGKNTSQHTLRGSAEAEVLRELLFIGASATSSRQVVTPDAAGNLNTGSLAFSLDATQVSTLALSPRLEQTFGGSVLAKVGANLIQVEYQGLLPDSFFREYYFSAASGPGARDLIWSFDARQNETMYERALSDNSRELAELNLRYKVLPQWALAGRLGYVDYQYEFNPEVSDEPTGRIWRAGVAWIPSPRTDLEIGVSENFFDRSTYATLNHSVKGLQTRAFYEESVTTRRQLQADYSQAQSADPSSPNPVIDPLPYLTISEDVFISKNARASVGYRSEEFTANISGYRDRRTYQSTGDRETVGGASVAIAINFSRRATIDAALSQSTSETTASRRTVITTISSAIRRDFGKNLEGSINLHRGEQTADDPRLVDYVAYFLTFGVRAAF